MLIVAIMDSDVKDDTDIVEQIEAAGEQIKAIKDAAASVIFGQDQVIENTLVTVLAGGHALLIGVPGVAKTLLVETLGTVLGLENNRIQFTPDLMPSDIIGSEVLEEDKDGKRAFRFIKGPVFTRLLMADEINRASPKTQSALLQAMQEKHVSFAGERHDLPLPFHVLATQNPLEQEGTYPLPEAQLDRFLMQIDVGYPDESAERKILLMITGTKKVELKPLLSAEKLSTIQNLVRQIPVGDQVIDAILKLVRDSRPIKGGTRDIDKNIVWGPGPRASQSLMSAIKAKALLDGRLSPSIDDVINLAEPILKHRMALSFAARAEGKTIEEVIKGLTDSLG